MSTDIVAIAPEDTEVANAYLEGGGSADYAANKLGISLEIVHEKLKRAPVKRYIDNVYMDRGYRNRNRLGDLLDEILESKLEEARENEVYTKADLLDVVKLIQDVRKHDDRMELEREKLGTGGPKNQTNIQLNGIGGGANYQALMDKLIEDG